MLKTRIITALILCLALIATIFLLPPLPWNLLVLGVVCLGAWEWAGLAKFNRSLKLGYVACIGLAGLLLFLLFPQFIQTTILFGALLAAIFWLFVAPLLLYTRTNISNRFIMALLGLLIIVPFGLSLIALRGVGPWLLIILISVVAIADSAAYFFGSKFGQHKLAPNISPGKTWEGVAGAILAVTLFGIGLMLFSHQDIGLIVLLWILAIFGVVGDLVESLFKRNAGVKDSGTLLPGHGGVLDRIDALTAGLPIMTFIFSLPIYLFIFAHG